MGYKMHLAHIILASLATVQIYYLYKFIYSIPLKYEIPETENEYVDIGTLLRGSIDNYREMRRRKHQPQPHPTHRKSGNNTASSYIPSTNLDVVDRF